MERYDRVSPLRRRRPACPPLALQRVELPTDTRRGCEMGDTHARILRTSAKGQRRGDSGPRLRVV